ncbi:acyltransferase family protein [Streptomyces aureoversilis]|uniref:Acyltransferase family protein n=1 Tax=Streptomyces aureoversilis TaxID=67277 RepID=A0ABV9ZXE9_9ACTN
MSQKPHSSASPPGSPVLPGSSRLPSLTGMRFVAAILVFVTHAAVAKLFADDSLNDVVVRYTSRAGYLGVGFFFVLSGFVLTWSAKAGDGPRRFYRRRLAKIYPNHFVTWLAGMLLMIWAGTAVTAGNTVPSLFLVQSWVPQLDVLAGTNGPSWSLSCELLFYLSFPLLHGLIRRIRPERLWMWVGIVIAAFVAVPLVAQLLPGSPDSPWQPVSWWRYWFVYFLPATRVLDFALGILMARVVMTGRWIGMKQLPALALLAAGYALMVFLPDAWGLVAPTALPIALLIAAAAVADTKGGRSPFATRPMIWLGEVSFAFYIVHFLVFQYGPMGLAATDSSAGRTWDTPGALGIMALTFALALFFGWLLYVLVERPAMRRFGRPRRRPEPAAGPAGSAGPAAPAGPASRQPVGADQR